MPISLGIETSCDDTCISLVTEAGEVLFHKAQNQDEIHNAYGGVFPEIASRRHQVELLPLIEEALKEVSLKHIDVFSVTNRPGLLGSLLVGFVTAKTLSMVWNKPLQGVNHIEGHILSPFLWTQKEKQQKLKFPFLALIVSGGHSHLFQVKGVGDSVLLGKTVDDAAGEALDKFAKMLGFPWPGGRFIDQWAQKNKKPSDFFSPIKTKNLELSFSGIKSSGRRLLEGRSKEWIEENLSLLCFSYQEKIMNHLMNKLDQAFHEHPCDQVVLAGGVSANSFLRRELSSWASQKQIQCSLPELPYCTDNAAMIAFTGLHYFLKGESSDLNLPCVPHHLEKDFFSS